jgi:hypothetical protein
MVGEDSTGVPVYISVILSVGGLLLFVTAVLLFLIYRKKRRDSAMTAKTKSDPINDNPSSNLAEAMHCHKAESQEDKSNKPHEESNRSGTAGNYATLQSVQPDPPYDACGPRRAPEDPVDGCQTTTTPPDLRTDNLDGRATAGGYTVLQFVQPDPSYEVCRPSRAPENPHDDHQNINQTNNDSVLVGGYAVLQPVQPDLPYDVCTPAPPRTTRKNQGQAAAIAQGVRFTEEPKTKAMSLHVETRTQSTVIQKSVLQKNDQLQYSKVELGGSGYEEVGVPVSNTRPQTKDTTL